MTTLTLETLRLPATALGPENPLPEFRTAEDSEVRFDPRLPEEDRRHLGRGAAYRVLPYRLQDEYAAELRPAEFRVAVLENEFLRATVLPAMGGRLLSLVHKPSGRELLERNPIMRLGNLGLRRAWFSGGVEWNCPHPGHHCLTCAPVFAARARGPRGEPALRLWEVDRVKLLPWQIDLCLPPGSPFLYARVRLYNPHGRQAQAYWWTNIAVPEKPDVRVLAPAGDAIRLTEAGLGLVDLDAPENAGTTYATRVAGSRDMFFRVPPGHRPWVAALDGAGQGLFQTSTARLGARKIFVWGNHPGGRRWQEFLGGPGRAYIEIQAGLTRTQSETVPMPARTEWAWTEAYGLLEADAAEVHAPEWSPAWRSAERALERLLPGAEVDRADAELAAAAARPPEEVLFAGSGWGALEARRRRAQPEPELAPAGFVFADATLGPEQAPWVELLERGALPEPDPAADPGQWLVQPEWAALLEESIAAGRGDGWLSWLHLGNARMEALDAAGARAAWEQSLSRRRSSWALRNLAVLAARDKDHAAAARLLDEAWEIGPRSRALAVERARELAAAGRHAAVREFVAGLPAELRNNERLVLADARAALETGDFPAVERALEREYVGIQEGSTALTDLWFEMHARKLAAAAGVPVDDGFRARARRGFPPPLRIDLRQKA